MSNPPAKDAGYGEHSLFDDDDFDDGENRTVVDTSFWKQPEIPHYPALATFGRFEILGRIARGGMAEVYLAREPEDDGSVRHIVVKRVLPEMEDNPDFLRMFLEEGKTAVRLYHTNVCHVYECGEIDGTAFMALEWVYGPSLQDVIRRAAAKGSAVPWPVAVEIVAQVASALQYVHHAKGVGGRPLNIVHRDVSPHNVMMSWSGNVKLLDFGIAKTSSDGDQGGGAAGKYGYMSPEQAQSRPIDGRSDIFALGIVLYEALTGKALYDRPTLLETLSAIVREPVPSVRTDRPELPEALDHIVQRALAKDPAARFQSAGEMRAALKQALRSTGQTVLDKRISLMLDSFFDAKDKMPLNADGKQVTGSFPALTAMGAAAAIEEVTFETFAHDSERPPPGREPLPTMDLPRIAAKKKKKMRSDVLLWVGFGMLFVLAMAGGGAAALWLLRN